MKRQSVLLKPENERYFRWDGRSLSLRPDAPPEVVRAWQAVLGAKSAEIRSQRKRIRLL